MPDANSISIVIPALNEEEELERSVRTAISAAKRWFDEFEILIFDDGSTDRTGAIADGLAAEFSAIRVFHHPRPSGLGAVLKRGLETARLRYFFWVDGKGATLPEALDRVFAAREHADLVTLYAVNQHERPLVRRLVSIAFRNLLNAMFSLNLRQHTHPTLCRTETARQFEVRTTSHAFQAELLVKMIKAGCTYLEIGSRDDFSRQRGHSKAFRISNVGGVALFFLYLFYDIHVRQLSRKALVPNAR
jgi:glycosyltransferase involved in cell wall biosynthesis